MEDDDTQEIDMEEILNDDLQLYDGEVEVVESDGTSAVAAISDELVVKDGSIVVVTDASLRANPIQVNPDQCVHPDDYPTVLLIPDAAKALVRAMQEYGHHVNINYSYRSYEAQKQIFLERYVKQASGSGPYGDVRYWEGVRYVRVSSAGAAAVPGTSNHGGGRAIDVDTRRDNGDGSYPDTVVFTSFNDPDRLEFLRISRKHGWNDTEGQSVREYWHLTYYPDEDQHKDVPRYAMGWPVLKKGHLGDDVFELQAWLDQFGYNIGISGLDSSFGPAVEKAVLTYQHAAGLTPDGVVGPNTQDAMAAGKGVPAPESTKLNGVDISHHQGTNILDKIPYDFAFVKASEGVGYVDPNFKQNMADAFEHTDLVGVYHFTRADLGNDPVKEADFFVQTVDQYLDQVLLCCDHEAESATKGGAAYAKKFMDRVKELTGITPLLYGSRVVVCNSSYSGLTEYPLWVARYQNGTQTMNGYNPDLDPGSVSPWPAATIFQYTSSGRLSGYSGNLDLDVFYGTPSDWKRLATTEGSTKPPTTEPTPPPTEPQEPKLDEDGRWGKNTTKRLQEYLGTPADGIVSQQSIYNKSALASNSKLGLTDGWQWVTKPTKGGSKVVIALQDKLGIDKDGELGPKTVRALQYHLGTPVDGKVSFPSKMVMALQKALNEGTLFN